MIMSKTGRNVGFLLILHSCFFNNDMKTALQNVKYFTVGKSSTPDFMQQKENFMYECKKNKTK